MTHSTTTTIFHSLVGKWMLERQIIDRLSKSKAKATGFARFNQIHPTEILYTEDVHVKWSTGIEHPATKHYKYLLEENHNSIVQYNSITKENGEGDFEKMYDLEFTHEENGEKLRATGDFLCGCDMYNAEYVFENMKKFHLRYNVSGKSKDYETITKFTKCSI